MMVHSASSVAAPGPVVSLRDVTKRFPGVVANDSVAIDLWPGEVHVLLGENGAGKSTLVGMLSGLQQPDEGEILIEGRATRIASPRHALDLGIGTVFQHSMLVPSLSLVDNFTLGGPWWKRPDREGAAARMREQADSIGIRIDPFALAGSLSLGEQQQVEIVRALTRGSRVLILDEATAMLTPRDAELLGELMRRLVARGLAVVFITHKLNEALAYGDRVSVLRLGRNAGSLAPEALKGSDVKQSTADVVRMMFGTNAAEGEGAAKRQPRRFDGQTPVLDVTGLSVEDASAPVFDVALQVHAGEILGIAGIDGNGQKQLAEALAGQRPVKSGDIRIKGKSVKKAGVGERRQHGVRYVTDDRLGEGTIAPFPVAINMVLKQIGDPPFWANGIERPAEIAANARRYVSEFDVRTPSIETAVGKLSGGNIQKVLLARELSGGAEVVIFAKPTYGLDVQNIKASRRRIREAAEAGRAVLLISTDLEELLELADRIAVMSNGAIVGTVDNDEDARQNVGELMSGISR
jgi:simple sugar transport system ATP-binding protein